MEMAGRLLAGLANREIRTRVLNLSEELRVRKKNRRAFDFSISVLEAYEALPDQSKVQAMAALGFTKSRALLPWSGEERAALAAGEEVRGITLAEAVELPSREVEKLAKSARELELQEQLAKERANRIAAESELKAVQKDDLKPGLTKTDAARRKLRLKAHGYAELIQNTAAAAATLLGELEEPLLLPQGTDDALVDRALCTGFVLELAAAKAAIDEAFALARARLEGRLSTRPDDVPVMSPVEIREARLRRAAMAEFTAKEAEAAETLAYARNELDGAVSRGAPPVGMKKIRRKDA
jgi:hypothetical protein